MYNHPFNNDNVQASPIFFLCEKVKYYVFDMTLLAVSNDFKSELPSLMPIKITSVITCPLSLIFFFNFVFFLRKLPIPLPFFPGTGSLLQSNQA